MNDKILSIIAQIIPKTFKGWLIYTLTIVATAMGAGSYTLMQSEHFQEVLLKRLDRKDLKARFDYDSFEAESIRLMNDTGAVAVVVWVTDIGGFTANKTVLYGIDRDKRKAMTDKWLNKTAPIYATTQSRIDVTHLLEGDVVCGKVEVFSEVGRRIVDETKAKFFCSSPVPPTAGHMIGVITAYFDREVSATKAIQLEMRRSARHIVYD